MSTEELLHCIRESFGEGSLFAVVVSNLPNMEGRLGEYVEAMKPEAGDSVHRSGAPSHGSLAGSLGVALAAKKLAAHARRLRMATNASGAAPDTLQQPRSGHSAETSSLSAVRQTPSLHDPSVAPLEGLGMYFGAPVSATTQSHTLSHKPERLSWSDGPAAATAPHQQQEQHQAQQHLVHELQEAVGELRSLVGAQSSQVAEMKAEMLAEMRALLATVVPPPHKQLE